MEQESVRRTWRLKYNVSLDQVNLIEISVEIKANRLKFLQSNSSKLLSLNASSI